MSKAGDILNRISSVQGTPFKVGDRVCIRTDKYQRTINNLGPLEDEGVILKVHTQTCDVRMDNPNAEYKEAEGGDPHVDEFTFDALSKV